MMMNRFLVLCLFLIGAFACDKGMKSGPFYGTCHTPSHECNCPYYSCNQSTYECEATGTLIAVIVLAIVIPLLCIAGCIAACCCGWFTCLNRDKVIVQTSTAPAATYAPPAYAQPAYGQPAYGQPAYAPPAQPVYPAQPPPLSK